MQDILPRNGVTCAEIECKDFLRLSLNDKKFKNVINFFHFYYFLTFYLSISVSLGHSRPT